MNVVLLKVYCSSYSAVAAGTFNWVMIDLLRIKDKSLEWTVPVLKCNQLKRKGNKESTVWKFTMESIVQSIWKEYGNYNMSLLMLESTVLRDTSTHLIL